MPSKERQTTDEKGRPAPSTGDETHYTEKNLLLRDVRETSDRLEAGDWFTRANPGLHPRPRGGRVQATGL